VSELALRVLFSVIAIPAALGIIYFGDAALAALLAIIAALGAREFYRIARLAGSAPMEKIGVTLAGLLPVVVHGEYRGAFSVSFGACAVVVLALLAASIWVRGVMGQPIGSVATTLLGIVYTGGMLAFGYALRYHPYTAGRLSGAAVVAFPLVLTWMSDIGAFAVGRAIGRRKLIPAVSPGKTVEGALGALVVCALTSWLYVRFALRPAAHLSMTTLAAVTFGVVISVAAQIGDLVESLFKRDARVKDSSHLIPGHGGILDRFDSLLFVLPTAYVTLGPLLRFAPGR
jgi:phosphatidate cytidylyltransferase